MKIPNKGDLKDCSNWRDITMLAVASKVLGKILIRRMKGEIPPNRSSYSVTLSSKHANGKRP